MLCLHKFNQAIVFLKEKSHPPVIHSTCRNRPAHKEETLAAQFIDCRRDILDLVAQVIRCHTCRLEGALDGAVVTDRLEQFKPRFTTLHQETDAHLLNRVIGHCRCLISQDPIEAQRLFYITAGDADVVEVELLHRD